MKSRILALFLSALALCGLTFGERGASGGVGSNSGASTWISGQDSGGVIAVNALHLNAPGKCLNGALTVCRGATTITTNMVFCQPSTSNRCLSFHTLYVSRGGFLFGIAGFCVQH